MPENNVYTQISNNSHFQKLIESALDDWYFVQHFKEFPKRSGIYAVYSGVTNKCLYVGQALNLWHRGLQHWALKKAIDSHEAPFAAYKVIEYDNPEKTRYELLYSECLAIGLLRPLWNIGTPAPRPNHLPARVNPKNIKTIHWTKLTEDVYCQPFHKLMLSDNGYLAPKIVELPSKAGNMYKTWTKVLYDREYAQKWLKITLGDTKPSEILLLLR